MALSCASDATSLLRVPPAVGAYVEGTQPELTMARVEHTIGDTLSILDRTRLHSVPIWYEEQATDLGLVDCFDLVASLASANALFTYVFAVLARACACVCVMADVCVCVCDGRCVCVCM
jgi:hypothetical protein